VRVRVRVRVRVQRRQRRRNKDRCEHIRLYQISMDAAAAIFTTESRQPATRGGRMRRRRGRRRGSTARSRVKTRRLRGNRGRRSIECPTARGRSSGGCSVGSGLRGRCRSSACLFEGRLFVAFGACGLRSRATITHHPFWSGDEKTIDAVFVRHCLWFQVASRSTSTIPLLIN
jgi:hypothetical protein